MKSDDPKNKDSNNTKDTKDTKDTKENSPQTTPTDFIRQIVDADVKAGKHGGAVVTRFPPEPNGFLHIGHAKAITIDYGIAEQHDGTYHLRFDDTNPTKEETRYAEAIQEDIRWLGYNWGDKLFHASDYFDQLHDFAVQLIRAGNAYVCDLSGEEMREYRGTLTEPGQPCQNRGRTVEENLDLFERMKNGEFEDGTHTLRAKIDMSSGNVNMRDPVIYRIMRATHHRTGDKWCIYPMYDFTHCLSDSLEGITHSFCDLDFEDHRPLYDWFLDQLEVHHPQQIEFARLNLSYTVMSKRKLAELVDGNLVSGWDDPRLPTLSGLRRRGFTPTSVRKFCETIGVAKRASIVDIALLEHVLREDLNRTSPRVMAVLKPLKVVIDNYPEDQVDELEAVNNPEDESAGTRRVPFSRELYIERDDFMEVPVKKFYRLSPGTEVRLRYAYFVKCESIVKDETTGEVTELHCTYDPASRGGNSPDGRKVKATLHWVSAAHAIDADVRLYDNLFTKENPLDVEDGKHFTDYVNPDSLTTLTNCKLEPSLGNAKPGERYQFERLGYFCVDSQDSRSDAMVFNRTVTLRDTWARIQKTQGQQKKQNKQKPKK